MLAAPALQLPPAAVRGRAKGRCYCAPLFIHISSRRPTNWRPVLRANARQGLIVHVGHGWCEGDGPQEQVRVPVFFVEERGVHLASAAAAVEVNPYVSIPADGGAWYMAHATTTA